MKYILTSLALLLGLIAYTNGPWILNAYNVSQITHVSFVQVLSPLQRSWRLI